MLGKLNKSLQRINLYLIILLLGEIGYFAIDIYLPSLPALTAALETKPSLTKLTIGLYLVGFGISQLIYGPLSDKYGRRIVSIIGTSIVIAASIGCVFSTSVIQLIIFRILQGLGSGAGTVMARAIIIDMFAKKNLIKASAYYSLAAIQIVTLTPILGGYIQTWIGWRGNFSVILLYSIVTFLLILKFLPETNVKKIAEKISHRHFLHNYLYIIKDKLFLGAVLCSSLTLASLIAYATLNPFLFQTLLHLTPVQYGYLSLINCVGITIGGISSSKMSDRVSPLIILSMGSIIMLIGTIMLFLVNFFTPISLVTVIIPIFIIIIGTNLLFSCTAVIGLKNFQSQIGSAGALFGSIQVLISSLTSIIVALIPLHGLLLIGCVFLVTTLLIIGIIYRYIRPNFPSFIHYA